MSAQALDLRRAARIVRRKKKLVGAVAALGLLAGVGYALMNPPAYTSSALVVVSSSVNISTQTVIATSDPVFSLALRSSPALRTSDPGLSLPALHNRVQAKRVTSQLMSIDAQGQTAAQAEDAANAVARGYASYVDSANSPVGQVPTRILQPATLAAGGSLTTHVLGAAGPGVVLGALIGAIIAVAIGRSDRRLRERDEIADSVGIAVLASVRIGHPSDATGWAKLLETYEPEAVDAWRLRKILRQLGLVGATTGDPGAGRESSVAMLSLASDRDALALGPQLAAFAASLGIPTALVVGPQQDPNTAATLRAACAAEQGPSRRSRNLIIAVSDRNHASQLPGGVLTIVVAVVDGQSPRVADTMGAATTVLGVTSGAVTAEQLARVAASAASAGRDVAGILVADPDPADQTTGRIPQVARPGLRRAPTRMTGSMTETR
jgi:capsular polysaccharide biosynthesis protein